MNDGYGDAVAGFLFYVAVGFVGIIVLVLLLTAYAAVA